jgi:hypothetical protein
MASRNFFARSARDLTASRLEKLRNQASELYEELRLNRGDITSVVLKLSKVHEEILELDMKNLMQEPVKLPAQPQADGVYVSKDNPKYEVYKLFLQRKSVVDQQKLDQYCEAGIREAYDLRDALQFRSEKNAFAVRVGDALLAMMREARRLTFEKEMYGWHKEEKHFCTDVREYTPPEKKKMLRITENIVPDKKLFDGYKAALKFLADAIHQPVNTDAYTEKRYDTDKIMTDKDGKVLYIGVDMLEFYERHYRKLLDLKFECQSVPAPKAVALGL